MKDPQVLNTLKRKREEIEGTIVTYEKRLKEARRDLAHVNATIHLFETDTAPKNFKVYQDINRLFRRGELVTICKEILAREGPQDTRQLSHHIMAIKGFEEDDELRKAIAYRIMSALRLQVQRGRMGDGGKRGNVRVWKLELISPRTSVD